LEYALTHHAELASSLNTYKPIKSYKKYLEHGYYPFYKEDKEGYHIQLLRVVNLIIKYDLAFLPFLTKHYQLSQNTGNGKRNANSIFSLS